MSKTVKTKIWKDMNTNFEGSRDYIEVIYEVELMTLKNVNLIKKMIK